MEEQPKYEYAIIDTKILHATDLGRVLKQRRKELGYTQVELAMMCNCSPRYIGDLENGQVIVRESSFSCELCHSCNPSLSLLLTAK